MDMFNKIKSAVTSALPGFPLSKDFEISNQTASTGPGLLWKIYGGVKRSTKEEASIFALEKKQLDSYNRNDREYILDVIKKGVSQLTRLRHPNILSVLQPLEETREMLAFATEPVFAGLSNVLGNHGNIPTPLPKDLQNYQLYEVEIKYGLIQILEALSFLHKDVKMIHRNLSPESIVINRSGSWKLAGFYCAVNSTNAQDQAHSMKSYSTEDNCDQLKWLMETGNSTNAQDQAPFYPFSEWDPCKPPVIQPPLDYTAPEYYLPYTPYSPPPPPQNILSHPIFQPFYPFSEWDPCKPPVIQPPLDYIAPEYSLTLSNVPESDIFSFGVLFYALFNDGKPLYKCNNQFNTFQLNVEELKRLRSSLGNVPEEMRDYVKLMLNTEPSVRPDAHQLSKMTYFTEDLGTVTLQYIDNIFQQDNLHKSQFFKGLTKVVTKLPKRINQHRILPGLLKEVVNHDMIPFLLPNLFLITDQATEQEYMTRIFPGLVPIFRIQEPVQIMFLLLQNMMLLLSKTTVQETKAHVLPMVYRALESNSIKVQELCLTIIPTFASMLEFTSLRTSVIPRVKKICMHTSTLTARVNSLVCMGKLLEYMDKWSVQDDVIPFLAKVPSKEPAVLMSILGICKVAFTHQKLGISKDIIINTVLPFIVPMAFDNNLNLHQFNAYMSVVHEMMGQVEGEHRSKLEQIDSMQTQQKTIEFSKLASADDPNALVAPVKESQSMMDKFLSGVGLSTFFTPTSEESAAPKATTTSPTRTTATSPIDAPRLPNQPAKVSLTLEEKQKLAKTQEQTKFYKSQTQSSIKPTTQSTSKDNRNSTKDLTSTLMNRNMTDLSKIASKSQSYNASQPYNASQSYNTSQSFNSQPNYSSGSTNYSPNYTSGYPATNFPSSQNFPANVGNNVNNDLNNKPKPDLSAFDALLPGKEKKSLNEISGRPSSNTQMVSASNMSTNTQMTSNFGQNQYRPNMQMNPVNQQIPQPMQPWGTQNSYNANTGYGHNANIGQGAMNSMGQGGMMGQNIGQNSQMVIPQNFGTSNSAQLSKSDVDSLLG